MRRIRYGSTTDGDGWQAEFAASLANSGLAPLTVRAYRHDVGLFLKWFAAIKGWPRVFGSGNLPAVPLGELSEVILA